MDYRIIDIEGVGQHYAEILTKAGIDTVADLLEKGASAAGRDALVKATGISSKLILKWVNHADLFRIKGVGPQFAELLEASGVDTVKELRHRVPANLAERLADVNEAKGLCNRTPSLAEVERWIAEAATLPPVVTY